MSVCGNYVKKFSEASHALPDGMHMNADYPFMLPEIIALDGSTVTVRGSWGKTATFAICGQDRLGEYGELPQSSSFEALFNRPPQKFRMHPFKDYRTSSISDRTPRPTEQEPQR